MSDLASLAMTLRLGGIWPWRLSQYSQLPTVETASSAATEEPKAYRPSVHEILRSRRVRSFGAAIIVLSIIYILFAKEVLVVSERWRKYSPSKADNPHSSIPSSDEKSPTPHDPTAPYGPVDWSRFAYVQYVTNSDYLCNSVMLFEILHRLGARADRLMMHPEWMGGDPNSTDARLLQKAREQYGVKLKPIEISRRNTQDSTWAESYTKLLAFNCTDYSRVLSLDSDSTVLQPMDELFLLPPSPVAMPRAYWLSKEKEFYLSSQIILIEPSTREFERIVAATNNAKGNDYDMEIVNQLYGKAASVLPHRPYDMLTAEYRGMDHSSYLGNDVEAWDPDAMLAEAKFLHFSDWPHPKPWIAVDRDLHLSRAPECPTKGDEKERKIRCRNRELWLFFYEDFSKRRGEVCRVD